MYFYKSNILKVRAYNDFPVQEYNRTDLSGFLFASTNLITGNLMGISWTPENYAYPKLHKHTDSLIHSNETLPRRKNKKTCSGIFHPCNLCWNSVHMVKRAPCLLIAKTGSISCRCIQNPTSLLELVQGWQYVELQFHVTAVVFNGSIHFICETNAL